MVPHVYEFVEPGWLTFRRSDGRIETLHYGIGERVEKLEPSERYCIVPSQRWAEIPMADGSFVIDRSDARMRFLYGALTEYKDIGL